MTQCITTKPKEVNKKSKPKRNKILAILSPIHAYITLSPNSRIYNTVTNTSDNNATLQSKNGSTTARGKELRQPKTKPANRSTCQFYRTYHVHQLIPLENKVTKDNCPSPIKSKK